MINALPKNKIISHPNMNLLAGTVFSTYKRAYMTNNYQVCRIKQLLYHMRNDLQLVKGPESFRESRNRVIEKFGKKVKIAKNINDIVEETVAYLIEKFDQTLAGLKKHI